MTFEQSYAAYSVPQIKIQAEIEAESINSYNNTSDQTSPTHITEFKSYDEIISIYIEAMKLEHGNQNKTKLYETYKEATKFLKVHSTQISYFERL